MKRPWFQFHLSTAIILMFVASGLLWLNMRPLPQPTRLSPPNWEIPVRGWPLTTRYFVMTLDSEEAALMVNAGGYWHWQNVALNVLCALVILVSVAALCEWRIHRRRSTDHGRLTTDD